MSTPPGLGDRIQLELSDPPEGISIQKVGPTRQGTEIVVQSDAAKIKPGLRGNLIVYVFPTRSANGKNKPGANRPRVPLAALPAIPFEVINN